MKVHFDEFDRVVFVPESETERVAIKHWLINKSEQPCRPDQTVIEASNFYVAAVKTEEKSS